jgi:tRNA modification GTPase
VAIAGPPNAGKSSLLNRLARRDAAIVSPFAGTTRDVIEVHFELDGYPVTLLDTAGIRDTDDPVEREGVRRARARAEAADLILWVVDAAAGQAPPASLAAAAPFWTIRNKIDLVGTENLVVEAITSGGRCLSVSALLGTGLDELASRLAEHARGFFDHGEPALVTRERHRVALTETAASLERALAEGASGREDILAEELRLAARSLERLTGRIDVDDILDVIFRDFCIGK